MARFCRGKENAQVTISAPGFAGGLRNSPPFQQAEHFHEGHFPRRQPLGKAGSLNAFLER